MKYPSAIGDVNITDLVAEFGTPLLVFDQAGIESRAKTFLEHFQSEQFATHVIYASKALSNLYLLGLLKELGLHLDVVSGGELFIAQKAKFPMDKVYFHGNNKSDEELQMALELGVGTIVLDHPGEAQRLAGFARAKGVKARVLLRVNPGIAAKTHRYIQTTTKESKFGMVTDDPQTWDLIEALFSSDALDFKGFHCHIGSQILDEAFFFEEAEAILHFVQKVEDRFQKPVEEINLGGGFGVRFVDESPIDLAPFLQRYIEKIEELKRDLKLAVKVVSIEPGRSMINPFGYLIYRVGALKTLPSGLNYAFVDGGMTDNPRPQLYEAVYDAYRIKNPNLCSSSEEVSTEEDAPMKRYRIAGKCCETGDVMIQAIDLPELAVGDLLVIPATGAYTASMSSNYNGLPRLAVVFVTEGKTKLAIRRETYEDLVLRDLPYEGEEDAI